MSIQPSRMDLSGTTFVMTETTRRLSERLKPIAVEANAVFEECIKALSTTPRPQMETVQGHAQAKRTISLPTRWGDISIVATKSTGPVPRLQMMVGSLEVSTTIPWSRPSSADLAVLLGFFREAVRSVVLAEAGDTLRYDLTARLAGLLEEHPEMTEAELRAAHPWWADTKGLRPGIALYDRATSPFDNGLRLPGPAVKAMEIDLHPPATTSAGRMTPALMIKDLDIRLHRRGHNPLDWMRLVARSAELRRLDDA